MAQTKPVKNVMDKTLGPLLKLQNERFEYAAKATSDVIKDWDITTNSIYWGDSFENRYGFKRGSDTNNADFWLARIHPEDRGRVDQEIYNTINDHNRTDWEAQYRFKTANDEYIFLSDRTFIIRDHNGAAIRAIGALHDDTAIKKYERELLLLNQQLVRKLKTC